MPKLIQTSLGLAQIRSESFDKKKGRVFLNFSEAPGLVGEQKIQALRDGSAPEPNTYYWKIISPFCGTNRVIATTARDALYFFLQAQKANPAQASSL